MLAPWKKGYDQPKQHIKKQRHYFADKGPSSESYGSSSSHVWMWHLDYNESWALKNWCFWTVVLEKTLKSSLDCKEIQPVHPKGNHFWILIGRTDAKAEAPILWPPDVTDWPIGKDLDAGKDWRQEKGMREDDGWMASPTQWTRVCASSGSWWWTRKPGLLQSVGWQRVEHNKVTELNWNNKILQSLLSNITTTGRVWSEKANKTNFSSVQFNEHSGLISWTSRVMKWWPPTGLFFTEGRWPLESHSLSEKLSLRRSHSQWGNTLWEGLSTEFTHIFILGQVSSWDKGERKWSLISLCENQRKIS